MTSGAVVGCLLASLGLGGQGRAIDDDLVEELAAKAERGYDVDQILRRRGGRPPIGSGPAGVESVRLDPELRRALAERAERDQESMSSGDHLRRVFAVAVFEYAETPPALNARARYEYAVFRASPPSTKLVTS